jgi:hypothetical protein
MGLEIISGVERRRRWSVADKLRIVAEADEPGAKVAEVARRHEISRSILWTWRKQARAGRLTMSDPPGFLPVEHVCGKGSGVAKGTAWAKVSGPYFSIISIFCLPWSPSRTMRILSPAEWCLRVARRISRTSFSAGTRVGGGGGFLAYLHPPWGYDEPEILRYSNRQFGLIGADAGQWRAHAACQSTP